MLLRNLTCLILIAGALYLPAAATEEEPAASTELPPVRVRLASLGTPGDLVLQPEGPFRILDGSGAEVSAPAGPLKFTASGSAVKLGEQSSSGFRVEAAAVGVKKADGVRRYPGSLVVSAAGGRLRLENLCSLEDYAAGVLSRECPRLFHSEAIAAIAVAIRSYSYRRAYLSPASRGPLCDTTHCQVYGGLQGVADEHRRAAAATAGQVALHGGQVIEAVYSADCGGITEANEAAWEGARPVPYLRPVLDAPSEGAPAFCAVNRTHQWTVRLPEKEIRALSGDAASELTLAVVELTPGGRARRVKVGAAPEAMKPAGRIFSGGDWRRRLGLSRLRSLKFEVQPVESGVELRGSGYGHGVGLCQFGANGQARAGRGWAEIVAHYYSGVEIGPAPPVEEQLALIRQPRMARQPAP